MAAVVSSLSTMEGSTGEENDDNNEASQSLKSWMVNNGKNLKNKTYQILSDEGIETIQDFKDFTIDDFEQMCTEMDTSIAYGDRVKLKRVLESFSSKDKFVDPQEIEAIENIKNEMKKLKNIFQNLNTTQTQINQKKETMTKNINNTFEELITGFTNRRKQLLSELDNMVNAKNEMIHKQIDIVNKNMQNYAQQTQKCQQMVRKRIELSEVKARKSQIMRIRDDVVKENKNVMNLISDNKVHTNILFMIEKDDIITYLKGIGAVGDCALVKLIDLQGNGEGHVDVIWKLLNKKLATKYDKVRVEWSVVTQNDDEKKQDNVWKYKEISVEDEKEDIKRVQMWVDAVGLYSFRVRVCDSKNIWTQYSNTKAIQIRVCASDTWFEQIIGKNINIGQKGIVVFDKVGYSIWHSVYGNKVVKPNECYEWKLKMNADFTSGYLYIGIIPDDETLLKQKINVNTDDHFVYVAHGGYLRNPSNGSFPKAKFMKKGDILRLKLDLQNNEVTMNINGVKYGAVPNYRPQTQNYRLSVSVYNQPCKLQLM